MDLVSVIEMKCLLLDTSIPGLNALLSMTGKQQTGVSANG
jgi:hypothetical protein